MVFCFKTHQLKIFSTPIGYSPVLRGLTYIQLGKGNQFHVKHYNKNFGGKPSRVSQQPSSGENKGAFYFIFF